MAETTLDKVDILIVDDNPANLHLLMGMLGGGKYEVRVATSGRRALEGARSYPPDLIMLDINMPEMDGYEVCRQLKDDRTTRDIPVIFISALDEGMDKAKAFEVGGADYVTKPFQFFEVLARLEHQLRLARLQREMARKNAELEAKAGELARKNAELEAKNEELLRSYRRTEVVFSALSDLLPGTVLDDRYRLEQRLGVGSHGVVYQATQLGLDRPVAVKILRSRTGDVTPEGFERFKAEGVAACRINHPNAALVLDFGITQSGIAYLVRELLRGHNLIEEIRTRGVLSLERCGQIVVPVCDVLATAHAAGIAHRDVKPEAIYIHEAPEGEIVKLLDFGLATLFWDDAGAADRALSEGDVADTPYYTAPERFLGQSHGARSDIYSLGATLYHMLSGRPPFEPRDGDPRTLAAMHVEEKPRPLSDLNPAIPEAAEAAVMQALGKDPNARPSAREISNAFVKALLTVVRRA